VMMPELFILRGPKSLFL